MRKLLKKLLQGFTGFYKLLEAPTSFQKVLERSRTLKLNMFMTSPPLLAMSSMRSIKTNILTSPRIQEFVEES